MCVCVCVYAYVYARVHLCWVMCVGVNLCSGSES
jgi:hypothetical protein